jgi:hypothetical protein
MRICNISSSIGNKASVQTYFVAYLLSVRSYEKIRKANEKYKAIDERSRWGIPSICCLIGFTSSLVQEEGKYHYAALKAY